MRPPQTTPFFSLDLFSAWFLPFLALVSARAFQLAARLYSFAAISPLTNFTTGNRPFVPRPMERDQKTKRAGDMDRPPKTTEKPGYDKEFRTPICLL